MRAVAAAIGRTERGETLVADDARAGAPTCGRPAQPAALAAVVVRPGGFTVGAHSLADELMRLAGRAQRRGRARARPLGQLVDGDSAAQRTQR